MLVQTNDGIAAADSLDLFDENLEPRTFTIDLMAYDAGKEENNELATHVPGPPFGGGERMPEADVIRPHPGISGDADVGLEFGWEGPVARLTVVPIAEAPRVVVPSPIDTFDFKVTLTNLTEGAPGQAGQVFSPPLIVTHALRERFVQMGESASDELRILAEDGANGPIAVLAEGLDFVLDVLALDGPLPPGESVTVMILGGPGGPHLSLYQIWINRLLIRRRSPLSLILEKELVAFRSGTGISHDAGSNQPSSACRRFRSRKGGCRPGWPTSAGRICDSDYRRRAEGRSSLLNHDAGSNQRWHCCGG
jgi:Fe2+ transport system protein FeoA